MEAGERFAKVTAALATFLVLSFVAVLVLVTLSMAAAFWLGNVLGSYVAAFLFVSIVHIGVGVLVYFFRRRLITNPMLNIVLSAFFEKED